MRAIKNQNSISENLETLDSIIGAHIAGLNSNQIKNRKKIIEVCHVGKFLMLLGTGERIEKLSEKPDFIISQNGDLIGLEHQIIIDQESKEREGFFENLFVIAESELQSGHDLPNFHANCYLKDNVSFRIAEKPQLIQEIKSVVTHFVLKQELLENSLIREMHSMPHTGKSVSPNFGAWWQKEVTRDVLLTAISRKELRLQDYMKNSGEKQWLLLVIGGLSNSSYELDKEINLELETGFNKVFLLEDFRARLFELK